MVMAQERLSFVVEPASLSFEGRGPVWGRVYIHAGDSWFPERGWEDIAVPVAAAWLQAVMNLVRECQSSASVHFMDGPFFAEMSREGDDVTVRLIEDRSSGPIVEHNVRVPFQDVIDNALEVSAAILAECRRNGWKDRDTETLQSLQSDLRGALPVPHYHA
jgi:hypothetical protein